MSVSRPSARSVLANANNVGGAAPQTFDVALADWVGNFERGVFAAFRPCQLCAPEIEKAGGGTLLNAIAPGASAPPHGRDATRCRIPARRMGEPTDVGYAALFLCSYAADGISGEVLTVGGNAYV